MRWPTRLTVSVACLFACCGSTAGTGASSSPGAAARLPAPGRLHASSESRMALIVLENRELGEVVGDGSAPYLQALAARGALAVDYHAITHPSLPNYIGLIAGDPLGISSDCTDCQAHGTTLVDQLEQAGIGWRAYMEGLPRPCFRGAASSGYVKRHDPFVYFPEIASNARLCDRIVPFGRLAADLTAGSLPPFSWISPDLCNDGHDCSTAVVSRFLNRLVPDLLASLGPDGTLAVVWDEGSSDSGCCDAAAGGRVPLLLLGPRIRGGYRLATPSDHYSLLRMVEDSFGLPRLRGAACPCTASLNQAYRNGALPSLARRR